MRIITLIAAALFCGVSTYAQVRYVDKVFNNVTVTADTVYGSNYEVLTGAPVLKDLMMDVYEPTGDTEGARPLFILAHAGSFLPKGANQLPFGTRKDSFNVAICEEMAMRGYVAVSMSYRLGWNPLAATQEERGAQIMQAVYRSMLDMKTCIRYFRDDAANGSNGWKIDPSKVIVAGNNSGGYTALTTAYLNRPQEISLFKFLDNNGNSYIDTNTLGKYDGSGATPLNNPQYLNMSNDVSMAVNIGGALGDSTWIDASDNTPVVSIHETGNILTPYSSGIVIVASTGGAVVEVMGSGSYHNRMATIATANMNAAWESPMIDLSSVYTSAAAANASNSPYDPIYREGLFPINGAANSFEPWGWYERYSANTDSSSAGSTGYGSKLNPLATPAKARAYIDTIVGMVGPRACIALNLPCSANFVGVDPITLESGLSIFPNPTKDGFTVELSEGITSVSVVDLNGRVVVEEFNVTSDMLKVNTSNLTNGIYTVRITSESRELTEKLIVQ